MDAFVSLFGVENHLTLFQECARAVLIFSYGLLLLRLSGRRTFGHWSALDVILSIIIGSALGRAMTGSASLPGTMAAAAVMSALHVVVAHSTVRSQMLSRVIEGHAVTLVNFGQVDRDACRRHMISQSDLEGALRQEGLDGLDNVKRMTLEPSGKLCIIKHDPCKPDP
jgi:uncharacterized membrane protein YcaP (DUF421 family)